MVSLLISLLFLVIIAGLLFYVISILPIGAQWQRVAQVILGLIVVLILLNYLLGGVHPVVRY